jgi:hypothetical protein
MSATERFAEALEEWSTEVPPTLIDMGIRQAKMVRALRDAHTELEAMTKDRDDLEAALRAQTVAMRQERLDYHAGEVRRLMGLPPKSPWASRVASERDYAVRVA